MRYGTSHFISRQHAEKYYAQYGETRERVDAKLKAGEIHLGEPELQPGQKLEIIWGEGRYAIEDTSPKRLMPKVSPRRPLDDDKPDGYLESDRDYVQNNMEAAVWFLDNRDALQGEG